MHASLLALSLLASQNLFLRHVPLGAGQDCAAVAASVKARFAAAAKVPVTGAVGRQDQGTETCNVSVDYEAEEPVHVESTEGGALDQRGTYGSLAECQADLAAQSRLFAARTHVPAAFAWCYRQSVLVDAGLSDSPVALHVEGYGEGVEHYHLQSIDLQTPLAYGDASAEAAAAALTAQGFHLARVRIRDEAGVLGAVAPTLQIAYYGAAEAPFRDVVVWNGSDEACAANLERVRGLLGAAGVTPFLAYCSGYVPGASYAGMFVHYVDNGRVTIKDGPRAYGSEAACQADADRLGGVCGVGWNGVEMTVIGVTGA